MRKSAFIFPVAILAAVALTALAATGYLLWFVLPPGTNRTHEVLGWLRHEWGAFHFWLAVVLLFVLAVHVALHWRWFAAGLCARIGLATLSERRPVVAGVLLFMVAFVPLFAAIVAAHLLVRPLGMPLHALVDETDRAPTSEDERSTADGADPAVAADAAAAAAAETLAEMTPAQLEREVASLLTNRCALCHGPTTPAEGVRADTVASLLILQHGTSWVIPGDPDASPIFRVVHDAATTRDGARRHAIPAAEIALLRRWVASLVH